MRRIIALAGVLCFLFIGITQAGEGWMDTTTTRDKPKEVNGWFIHVLDADIDGSVEQLTSLATTYAQLSDADTLEVISSDSGDTTQTITVYGIDSSGNRIYEAFELNGDNAVSGSTTFALYDSCELDATTSGDITVRDATTDTTITQIHAGSLIEGEAQKFMGEYDSYLTSWTCGVTTTTGNILFELWWFDTATDVRTPVDYKIIDRMYIDGAATSPYNATHTYEQAIKLPAGGALQVWATGSAANADGFTNLIGYDIKAH